MIRANPGFQLRPRRPIRLLRPAHNDAGFVLVFAFFGALMLLLSSLSIQTAALQSRASEFSLRRRNQREDLLSSAGQLVAGRLQHHPCLLGLPLAQWNSSGAACITADELTTLRSGTLPAEDAAAGRYEIKNYQLVFEPPEAAVPVGGDLDVLWFPVRGSVVQRRFRLDLVATADPMQPPRLRGIRP